MKYLIIFSLLLLSFTAAAHMTGYSRGEGGGQPTVLERRVFLLEEILKKFEPNYTRWYLDFSGLIFSPKSRVYDHPVDLGIGASIGVGKYINDYHTVSASVDYDIYIATSLKYLYDFNGDDPYFKIGPVFGIKNRIINTEPFDRFIDPREDIPSFYGIFGFYCVIPTIRHALKIELNYWAAKKSAVVARFSFLL